MLEDDLQRQEGNVIVAVINHETKRRMAQVAIPAHKMTPSEQYNLEIALNAGKENSRLWVTAMLHDSPMGEKALLMANPHLTRLELLLKGCGIGRPLPYAAEECVAVMRVVQDAEGYTRRVRELSAAMEQLNAPADERPNTYPLEQFTPLEVDGGGAVVSLPEASRAALTPAVGPGEQPVWNETVYFTVPTDQLHTDGAALLVEMYQRGVHLEGREAGTDPISRDGLRTAARAREEIVAPPPEMFLGYAIVPLAPLVHGSAGGGGRRQTRTRHVVDELPIALFKSADAELGKPVLQLELHTWNADAIAPAEVAPPPAGHVSPTAIAGAEGDGLVERLLREIDEKKDVIRRCGVEVIELRRQGAQLAAHNADLRSMLEKEKLAAANLAHDGDEEWEMLDLHELRKRSRLLRTKYRGERQANETLVNKLQLLQNAVMKKNAAEDRLRELEDAHVAQSELVAKLRTDNSTVQKWRKTAHEQEGVIVKLEALMEQALGAAHLSCCICTSHPASDPAVWRRREEEAAGGPRRRGGAPARAGLPRQERRRGWAGGRGGPR